VIHEDSFRIVLSALQLEENFECELPCLVTFTHLVGHSAN
jgi:hypothetical protein